MPFSFPPFFLLLFVFPVESLKEALSFYCNSPCHGASEEQNPLDSTTRLEAPPPASSSPPVPAEEEPQVVDAVRSEEEELNSLELQLQNQNSGTDSWNMHLKVQNTHENEVLCKGSYYLYSVTLQINTSSDIKDNFNKTGHNFFYVQCGDRTRSATTDIYLHKIN